MWCKVCSDYDQCKNANDRCVMCSRNILYKDYFESKEIEQKIELKNVKKLSLKNFEAYYKNYLNRK